MSVNFKTFTKYEIETPKRILPDMYLALWRSSRPEVFRKKDVHRNFVKFTGKHLCQSLFFNKLAGGGGIL